jgi:probable phosphoglycerate mutase
VRAHFATLVLVALAACSSPEKAKEAHAMRVYVVRHGESWKNAAPPPGMKEEERDRLTDKGKEQAKAAAALVHADRAVTSPLGRARETADIVASARPGTIVDERLRPLDDGKGADGKPVTFSWRVSEWKAGRDPRPEGGESLEDGQKRAVAVLEEYAKKPDAPESLAVVTHADIIAALLGRAAGTRVASCWAQHEVPTGSVSVIEIAPDGTWKLVQQAK